MMSPYFSLKKLMTSLVITVCKVMTFLAVIPPSDLIFPAFFINLAIIFFISFGYHPLEGVTWGISPSDAK